MEALLIVVFCAAICGIFIIGWALATVAMCVWACIQGKPVRPVFDQMMSEW